MFIDSNWVVDNLNNALNTWNDKLAEIWNLITLSPDQFKDGVIWEVMTNIFNSLQAIALALLVLFFVVGLVRTCSSFTELKKPEHVFKSFIRFACGYSMKMSHFLISLFSKNVSIQLINLIKHSVVIQ